MLGFSKLLLLFIEFAVSGFDLLSSSDNDAVFVSFVCTSAGSSTGIKSGVLK